MATIIKYTQEQTEQLQKAYEADASDATIVRMAELFGKTNKSVIAKLAALKIYKAKEVAPANQKVKKAELVARIATMAQLSVEGLASLEKADRLALLHIHNFMERQANSIKEMQAELEAMSDPFDDGQPGH